jgi:DNA-directed RNA polymerase specialized sigma24 family protein
VNDNDDDDLSLGARLARLWSAGDHPGFGALVFSEVMPLFCRTASVRLKLQQSDAEDCLAEALESFIERPESASVSNPYGYLTAAAWNNGATLYRRRERELVLSIEALLTAPGDDQDRQLAEGDDEAVQADALVPENWAVVAVEETLGEIEAAPSWATVVIEEALKRLTLKQRSLIKYLANQSFDSYRHDFDLRSKEAAAALGMKPDAFRKAKQRAYEALREAIPQIVTELHLRPPARFVAAFAETRGTFMADDPLGDGS